METRENIALGKTALGIELGSTRIKAVLIDETYTPVAYGVHNWENQLVDGVWTYSLPDVWAGIQDCYTDLNRNVEQQYGTILTKIGAIGISAMMHGYLPFDQEGTLLTPFRTWRNTMTSEAANDLTARLGFQIPQRWSVAHVYQAILNEEAHVARLGFLTTLAGYVHWQLTGEKVLGIGDASGMFPIDSCTMDYSQPMLQIFNQRVAELGIPWKLEDLLPTVLSAGQSAGCLTPEGALLLDPSGRLTAGIPLCPPEGDAGTGMTATNTVRPGTGNLSAGTSSFAMVVLEHSLEKLHPEIDLVTTPDGKPVAMVHCNNCTSDLNAWANLFQEFAQAAGLPLSNEALFDLLFRKALEGDPDGGGLLPYNYLSGESITGFDKGRPLFLRRPDSTFTLANFMRSHLLSALATLRIGFDILQKEEQVQVDRIIGHGGFFKTDPVGRQLLAAALGTPVAILCTAGEGGPWGMALLAAFLLERRSGETLEDFLDQRVFLQSHQALSQPEPSDGEGFQRFMARYVAGLPIERAAVEAEL